MRDVILTDKESSSAHTHIIQAPIENVDIAAWLFKLPEGNTAAVVLPTTFRAGLHQPTAALPYRSRSR
jgi:hypothetical protein